MSLILQLREIKWFFNSSVKVTHKNMISCTSKKKKALRLFRKSTDTGCAVVWDWLMFALAENHLRWQLGKIITFKQSHGEWERKKGTVELPTDRNMHRRYTIPFLYAKNQNIFCWRLKRPHWNCKESVRPEWLGCLRGGVRSGAVLSSYQLLQRGGTSPALSARPSPSQHLLSMDRRPFVSCASERHTDGHAVVCERDTTKCHS